MERINKVKDHLATTENERENEVPIIQGSVPGKLELKIEHQPLNGDVKNFLDLPSRKLILHKIPSGLMEGRSLQEVHDEVMAAFAGGRNHQYLLGQARKFQDHARGLNTYSNFWIPFIYVPYGDIPRIDSAIIVVNHEDARRLAKTHMKKGPLYRTPFFGKSVLATNDNQLWMDQRKLLSSAFLPHSALAKIFHISLARAKVASERVQSEMEVNEFLSFEAMAQLQLAMFGETQENMEKSNTKIRDEFKRFLTPQKRDEAGDIVFDESFQEAFRRRRDSTKEIYKFTEEIFSRGERKETKGPVMDTLVEMCPHIKRDIVKNDCSTLLFAGHDTTANWMTHFLLELSRNQRIQRDVQKEIDFIFDRAEREGRDLIYSDLGDMHWMKRCLNETLRLWPSVPNGTFRETEFDDHIQGVNGERVEIKKGTQIIIPVYCMHHNKFLWGEDADEFNPEREWLPEEDWYGNGLLAQNPESHRFCPFTYGPRDCMGKNFAQMESRLILSNILRKYDVSLNEKSRHYEAVNIGTLSPKNGLYLNFTKRR